ncbi:beta-alanine-activating enzyme, partial [Chrysoperla carnea]|uniref:beta-alanine-activating enzyme n=1 Tax=Chrysoperla carnea TaxID=189513 RepID=UPI001D065243
MENLFELFAKSTEKNNTKTSLIHYKNDNNVTKFTRLQLKQETEKIYNNLKENVNSTNQVIGILLKNKIALPPIVLGISKCKNGFICLDLENQPRNEYLIQQLGINLLFSCENVNQNEVIEELTIFNVPIKLLKLSTVYTNHEDDISYVISTSGTTGKPKLVKVTNECIMHNIESFRSMLNVSSDDVLLLNTPTTFDPYIIELYLSLVCNATLVITDPPQLINHPKNFLQQLFNRNSIGITILQMAPSIFLNLGFTNIEDIICDKSSTLRVLALGGEHFTNIKFLLNLMKNNTNLQIFNLYGITEVSCWASVYEVHKNYDENDLIFQYGVPLGDSLNGTDFLINNQENSFEGRGDGELFIDCTNRICHIPSENPIIINNRSYRPTGDIVHMDPTTKSIYYVGRKNRVIKKFGHRISLDQIEILISNFTAMPCACLWNTSTKKISVFIKSSQLNANLKKQIREYILQKVSKAALIDEIHLIDHLPITNHGKIDRNELLLDLDKSFSTLGGTSIIAMEIVNQIESFTNKQFPPEIFEHRCKRRKLIGDNQDGIKFLNDQNDRSILSMKIQWKYNMEACVDASPCVYEYRDHILVIIGSHSHKLSIVNFRTGDVIFEQYLDNRIEGTANCFENFVFVGCYSGHVYCIDLDLKKVKWKYKTNSRVKTKPIICKNDTAIIVGSYDNKLHCIDTKTGSTTWCVSVLGSVSSHVLIHENYVFVATIQGNCYCFNEKDGNVIWFQNIGTPIFAAPVLFENSSCNGVIYPDVKGLIHCFSYESGNKMWEYQANDAVYSSVIINKQSIYFGCHDSCLYGLNVMENNNACTLKVKYKFDSSIFASPCFFQKFIVVATMKGSIYVVDSINHTLISKIHLDGEIFSTPVVFQNNILFGCRDDFVYCFE